MRAERPELLTVEEAAEVFRLEVRTLYQQRSEGREPGTLGFHVGARVRFRAEDIARWLDEQAALRRNPDNGSR